MTLAEIGLFSAAFLFTAMFSAMAGAGGGVLMTAVLSGFIPPAALVPVQNAILFFNSAVRSGLYRKDINWNIAWPFVIGLAVGSFIGATVYVNLPEDVIGLLMGIAMLVFTWGPIKSHWITKSIPLRLGLGTVHGFLSSLTGVGGLLQATFTKLGLKKNERIGTFAVVITFNNVWRGLAFAVLGVSLVPYWKLIALAIPLAFLGGWFGKKVGDQIPERIFDILFKVIVTVFALRMLYQAVF